MLDPGRLRAGLAEQVADVVTSTLIAGDAADVLGGAADVATSVRDPASASVSRTWWLRLWPGLTSDSLPHPPEISAGTPSPEFEVEVSKAGSATLDRYGVGSGRGTGRRSTGSRFRRQPTNVLVTIRQRSYDERATN